MLRKLFDFVFFFLPTNVKDFAYFEYRSMRGRLLAKRLKLNPSEKNYINLGSGALRYKGFINVDFFGGKETGVDYGADLRYPLLIDDNSLDGIFCEHTLEHLTYKNVDQLLAECYRILKPGGTMRIIVPDVSLFVENYAKNNKEWFDRWEYLMFTSSTDSERSKRKLVSKMSAISFVTQEYLHVACWDYETMHHYLVKNKFREIKKSAYRQSVDPMLNIDLDDAERRYVSLHMDAVK